MRTNCCHNFLAFSLKFINFVQLFVGISTVIYSIYQLNQWRDRDHIPIPPSLAPSPYSPMHLFPEIESSVEFSDQIELLNDGVNMVYGLEDKEMDFVHNQLPAPWFIYVFMGVGVVFCCISCIGHIAAEAFSGCCLCFYTLLTAALIMIEGALVAFFAVDHHWQRDLPVDQTGEVDNVRSFVEENADLCKWLGIALLMIQALSLLLALILRALVSTRRGDSDIEEDYIPPKDAISEPLLGPQSPRSLKDKVRGTLSDIWSARMRQKYSSNNEYRYRELNPNAPLSPRSYA